MAQFTRLLSRRALEMRRFASDDGHRPALGSVLVEASGRIVATDGKVLGVLASDDTASPAEEFPLRQGLADSLPMPETGILIPASIMDKAAKALPKKTHLTVLQNAALWIGEREAALVTTDLDGWQEHRWTRTDDVFPPWEKVWPTGEPVALTSIALNGVYLALIQQVCRAMDKVETEGIAWRFHGSDKATEWTVERLGLRGILMPVRLGDAEFGIPKPRTVETQAAA